MGPQNLEPLSNSLDGTTKEGLRTEEICVRTDEEGWSVWETGKDGKEMRRKEVRKEGMREEVCRRDKEEK